jgi:hypothetical protein
LRSASTSPADRSAPPAAGVRLVEVRFGDELLKRVAPAAADQLVSRGWGEWIGSGRRRYVRLTQAAPVSALHGVRGHDGTAALAADHTCKVYRDGQLMGAPRSHREFLPLP